MRVSEHLTLWGLLRIYVLGFTQGSAQQRHHYRLVISWIVYIPIHWRCFRFGQPHLHSHVDTNLMVTMVLQQNLMEYRGYLGELQRFLEIRLTLEGECFVRHFAQYFLELQVDRIRRIRWRCFIDKSYPTAAIDGAQNLQTTTRFSESAGLCCCCEQQRSCHAARKRRASHMRSQHTRGTPTPRQRLRRGCSIMIHAGKQHSQLPHKVAVTYHEGHGNRSQLLLQRAAEGRLISFF